MNERDEKAEKAMGVLIEIAESEHADDDTRIRAACAILDRLDKVPAEAVAST